MISQKRLLVQAGQNTKEENRSGRSVFFKSKPSVLYLKNGSSFEGFRPAWSKRPVTGEVVFNTGMTGYVESLTDPSYSGQILVFTYPLIGNYGVCLDDSESPRIQVNGVIFNEGAYNFSHSSAQHSLFSWLSDQNIPALFGVDTRALTKHLRASGTMAGTISDEPVEARSIRLPRRRSQHDEPVTYNPAAVKKVIFVDCGAKDNILRSLLRLPLQIKRVPANYDYTNEDYDGVILSNGPGDPANYKKTIQIVAKAIKRSQPVFGICLGSQLMALAAGGQTYKLRFGHRGHNQPCIQDCDQRCFITSQNHSYAVRETSLPKGWRVNFRNLNDGSVEGIEHIKKPHFAVQFHPEACPGPTDTNWLFEKFYQTV
ncbi:MAG TPA: glutamine-hydrolyzing carbamoyl-phosphate synthase small subunit [Candidatus Saccharimonadales bacterium]|nr:glutamine-hydrolyzing carbamoyl-phosphate synthase small subunit [Candidatus Saccharimonadales bacterium]